MANTERFEVFFDGGCPLCRREIEMIQRKDHSQRLILTDISRPEFDSETHSMKTLMSEIHGRRSDGKYVKGVEVFREIYDRLGYSWLVSFSRLPLIRNVLDLGYRIFAKLRFLHAQHRMKKSNMVSGKDCGSGKCGVKPVQSTRANHHTHPFVKKTSVH